MYTTFKYTRSFNMLLFSSKILSNKFAVSLKLFNYSEILAYLNSKQHIVNEIVILKRLSPVLNLFQRDTITVRLIY